MYKKTINVVITGATGYVGLELIKYLTKHSKVKIVALCSENNSGKHISYFDKSIKKKLPKLVKINKVDWRSVDLLFTSLPNGRAQNIINKLFFLYPKMKFIDLSADFRLTDPKIFKKWYKINHKAKNLIKKSIYALSELVKKDIKKYRIISNPGCYATSIQIPLIPLLKNKQIDLKNITIDSKSGYSGAGKFYKKKFTYDNFYETTYAYSVKEHRHIAEIDQEFKKYTNKTVNYTFNPHILPTFKGILSSIYIRTKKNLNSKNLTKILKKFYKKNNFIKILPANSQIGTNTVLNSNNCEISICQSRYSDKITIFSAIDNLGKGAAGQAIQNMNLIFSINESEGLK